MIYSQSQLTLSVEGTLNKQAARSTSRHVNEVAQTAFPHAQESIHTSPQDDDARNTANSLTSRLDVEGSEHRVMQSTPPELSNFANEIVFVLLCSMGLLLFGVFLGDVLVNQLIFPRALRVTEGSTPWLVGSFLLANGVTVIIAGSVIDLLDPKLPMTLAFGWLVIWNLVLVFSIHPGRAILFFVARGMQGVAVGVLQASSMSLLGRLYAPGLRKNRIFSLMAAMAPIGFLIGCLKGGALEAHLPWIFAANAILSGLCVTASIWCIPAFAPASNSSILEDFDGLGALCAAVGCGLVIFGLTQGAPSGWQPYTYSTIVAGMLCFGLFYLAEQRAARPLIDNRLWTTPGFTPLAISYFLGYGAYIGGWMFYAVRFFLSIQQKAPITVALYLIPNLVSGIAATWVVSRTLHLVPGHWLLAVGMIAFTMGPVFFLPQTATTTYWALAMPGIALVTFGPDLTFAAASIFITSSVPKSFQGAAGSLLVTIQNLSAAIGTALADTVGQRVNHGAGYDLDLGALRAIWWLSLGMAVVAALICAIFVRIPKAEEKEHVL